MQKSLAIDETLTQKVANLARLELTPAEVSRFTGQLSDIVGYIDQLQAVEVQGVAPLTHPLMDEVTGQIMSGAQSDGAQILREDVVIEFGKNPDGRPKTLGPAPESVFEEGGGSFKVPQVIK